MTGPSFIRLPPIKNAKYATAREIVGIGSGTGPPGTEPPAGLPGVGVPDTDLTIADGSSVKVLTAQPSGETDYWTRAPWYDTSGANQIRVVVDDVEVAGAGSARVAVKYKATVGGSLASPGAGGAEVAASIATTGPQKSSVWTLLDPAAIGDRLWKAVGVGGNGSASPAVGGVHIQFRQATAIPPTGCAVPTDFAQNDDFSSYANNADFQDYATGGQTPSRPLMYDWGFWNLDGGLALDTGVKFAGHNTLRSETIYDSLIDDDFVRAGQIGGRFSNGGTVGNTETPVTYDTQGIWVGAVVKFGPGFATRDTGALESGYTVLMVQIAEAPYTPCRFRIQIETETNKVELYKFNLTDSTEAVVDTGIAASSLLDGEWHFFALHLKRTGGGPTVFTWDVKAYVNDACTTPTQVASMTGVNSQGPGPDAGIRYFAICGQGNGIASMIATDPPVVANIGYFAVCPDTVNPNPFAP